LAGKKVGSQPIESFKMIGCHTDSPVLKIAPSSKVDKLGYRRINVMTYGGGLWRTWFDRDLSLAGKVIVVQNGALVSKYWSAIKPLLVLPSLCIHLDKEREVFKPNFEDHLKPMMAMSIIDQLFGEGVEPLENDNYNIDKNHWNTLTELMANDLSISREDIVTFELSLCDFVESRLTGIHEEFVSSPRLDNLASSFAALDALVEHMKIPAEKRDHAEVDMILLFDHEEIGSKSA
jgi:aspartyl aminopeptidase